MIAFLGAGALGGHCGAWELSWPRDVEPRLWCQPGVRGLAPRGTPAYERMKFAFTLAGRHVPQTGLGSVETCIDCMTDTHAVILHARAGEHNRIVLG